jgi:hypothetical protein
VSEEGPETPGGISERKRVLMSASSGLRLERAELGSRGHLRQVIVKGSSGRKQNEGGDMGIGKDCV